MIEKTIALAIKKGKIVKPSLVDSSVALLDCGPAIEKNERMRITADGALLSVDEGRYWQIGPVKDIYNWLKTLPEVKT